jgi:hypothetical protein
MNGKVLVGQSFCTTMKGDVVDGFIQRCDVSPTQFFEFNFNFLILLKVHQDFCITLQAEIQLDVISNVPEQQRYSMIDRTGSLVKITKHMNRHYNF